MPTLIVQVEPTARGGWVVRTGEDLEPLSEHESATAAERAARGLVQRDEMPIILMHDRYARVHRV